MKTSKRILAIVLTVIMVMSLATTAFAAMEGELTGGTITIENAVDGNTYSAYQILYLESYNADAGAYAYKANSAWEAWLKTQTAFVNFDEQGYVTWVDGADAAAFAKAAQNQLAGKTADKTAVAANGKAVLSELNLGYYLVDTTLGTLCSLDTTNPSVKMREKNEAPTITKEVKEDSTGEWGETNDASIDEVVEFKATITVKKGAVNYILHDKMSDGLTYQGVSEVKIGETTVDSANYEVKHPGECGCTFEVVFDNEYLATLPENTEIVVYYSAVVNENAVIAGEGNPNTVYLSYGEKPTPDCTPEDTTVTYVWELPIFKYTGKEEKTPLAGAKFSLYTDAECTQVVTLTKVEDNVYKVDADGAVTEIETDATGTFQIMGLDSGVYYVKEIQAPAGYNMLAGTVTVEITDKGEVKQDDVVVNRVEIENNTGTELPSTGGMGTTMLYFFGAVLALGAVVLLVTKRRMNYAE